MLTLVSGAGWQTALVQELYKPITAKHGYFISGKFDQGSNVPYSAIIDAPGNSSAATLENRMSRWNGGDRACSLLWAATTNYR